MRVRVDSNWVMEVSSVQLSVNDDRSRSMILFKMADNDDADPYVEFLFPEEVSEEEADMRFEALSKELLEKGYADFSEEDLDLM